MPVRVSTIVPVYNPGSAFDDLIASLDRQTLPASDFEVLLCDDGSDETTRERLARVARERPNVRVLTLPHSGWPGTPRNAGIDAAVGDYVYFVDQDDFLYDDALERLCDFADRHGSDVVVGKEVGIGRALPTRIFRRDIPRAVLGTDPLLEMLTPHKLFRTAFLRANGIRFPDGKVRLEDHLFVMQAYFAAQTISVLASTPCYAWVHHAGSASASRIDPDGYFPHMETVLALVEQHTEPGALRDRLLRHWYRGKVLKRIRGRRMVDYPEEYRDRFLDVVTPLTERWFGQGVEDGLALPYRAASVLLREGRRDDLLRLAEFEAGLECRARLRSASWSRGGGLRLVVDATVLFEGEEVLSGAWFDGQRGADAAPNPIGALLARIRIPARDDRGDRIDLVLREPDGTERVIAGARGRAGAPLRVAIDPLKLFDSADPSPGGVLRARVHRAGWSFEVPVTTEPRALDGIGRSPILAGRPCTLVVTGDRGVALLRDAEAGRWRDAAGRTVRRIRAGVGRARARARRAQPKRPET